MPDHTVVTSLSTDQMSPYIQSLHDDEMNEIDLVDTHVLDSRSVNTDEHDDIKIREDNIDAHIGGLSSQEADHYATINDKLGTYTPVDANLHDYLSRNFNNLIDNFSTVETSLTDLSNDLSSDTGSIQSLISTVDNHLHSDHTTIEGELSSSTSSVLTAVSNAQSTLHNDHNTIDVVLSSLAGQLIALTAAVAAQRRAQPAYTVSAETDWDATLEWDVPADFYLVTITAVGPQQGDQPSGVQRFPHVGWCAVKGPNGSVDVLQQIDFQSRCVTSNGVVPRGLLLYCKPGTTGHVQACVNN